MQVLTIRGCNLASLAGEFEIDLTAEPLAGAGLFAITGDTGSGKSTLLDALCLALYGTFPRLRDAGREDVPDSSGQTVSVSDPANILRRGTGRGWAEVDFVANDAVSYRARWEVYRARDRFNGNLQKAQRTLVRIDDGSVVANSVRTVDAEIPRLTGLTFDQFRRTVLLAQGDFDAFLMADNAERGDLLEKITGTEIYAEISRRVYSGCAAQRAERDRLKERHDAQHLLTAEQRAALDTRRDDLNRQIDELRGLCEGIERELSFRTEVRRKRSELAAAANEHLEAKEAALGAEHDRERLQKLLRVEPLRSIQLRINQLQNQLPGSKDSLDKAATDLESAAGEEVSAADDLVNARQAELEAEASCSTFAEEWRAAGALDNGITSDQGEVAKSQDELKRAENALTEAQTLLTQCTEELGNANEKLAEIQAKLVKHSHFAPIADRLQEILSSLDTRQSLSNELADLKTALATADEVLTKASDAEAASVTAIAGFEAELSGIETSIHQEEEVLNSSNESALRQRVGALLSLQGKINQAIALAHSADLAAVDERNAGESKKLAQQTLDKSLAEQTSIGSNLNNLQAELRAASQAELTVSEAADKFRSELTDGKPCPVCGSPYHPYADGSFKALMGAANEIRLQREQIDSRILAANTDLQRVATAIGSAQTSLLVSATMAHDANKRHLQACEQYLPFASTLPEALASLGISATIPADLQQNSEALLNTVVSATAAEKSLADVELAEIERRRLVLAGLRKKQERGLANLRDGQNREKQLRGKRESAEQNRQSIDSNSGQTRGEIDRQDLFLAPFLGASQFKFTMDTLDTNAAKIRSQIEFMGLQLLDWRSEEQGVIAKLAELRPLAATRTAEHSAALEWFQSRKNDFDSRTEKLNGLRSERQLLLCGEVTSVHRDRFESALKNAREKREKAQGAGTKAASYLHECQRIRDLAEARFSSVQKDLGQAIAEFTSGCESISLTGEEVGTLLAVSPADRDALIARIEALDHRLREATAAEQLRKEDLIAIGSAAESVLSDPESDDLLRNQLEEQCRSSRQFTEEVGSIRQQLEADDQGRIAAGELQKQLEAQEITLRAWAEVEEAIGSRQGDRFRIFAQSITLEHLIQLANRNLKNIGPRYQLSKGGENNLALHIVDCDMEGEHRSTRSLSGGERFLVSLALALALSALNGRQSFVDTLFIDEGFGALDSDTLDTAVGALEIIQSFGRKVGVVTHVAGIKERLPVQVIVEKTGAGRSRVRLFPPIYDLG